MINDFYTIAYLITSPFNTIFLLKFMQIFFQERKASKAVCAVSYVMYTTLVISVYLFIDIPILLLVMNYILMFCITFNYESNIQKKLLSTVYILVFMLIPELIVAACTGYLQFSFFTEGAYGDTLGLVAMRLLTYMMALLVERFKAVRNNQQVSVFSWMAAILIPLITLIMEIMLFETQSVSKIQAIVSIFLMFILNITAFYLYDSLAASYTQKSKVALLEKENELYSKQCELMQTSTQELQAFRHDLNNQLVAMNELLQNEKYDDLKVYLHTLSKLTGEKTIYSTTGNVAVDGIINYKLQNAMINHIKVNAEIAVPSELSIEISDIITVLGNLLDNAISAIMQLQEEERSLSFKLIYGQERLIISMSNPYKTDVRYENGEIVTTKKDNQKHGFGIKNIEKVVKKYNGYMEITHDNQIFTADMLLYLPE